MPAHNFIDLTGHVFGKLTVIKKAKTNKRIKQKTARWWCQCSCGKITVVDGHCLRRGNTKSCGCLHNELLVKRNIIHGMSHAPEYRTWHHMKERCYNPNEKRFKDYGGRGIIVCDEWKESFSEFYSHIGPRPTAKHSIDRINNNRGYFPGNVRWALPITQSNNKRTNRIITINGWSLTIAQWARFAGIRQITLFNRINILNWSHSKAIFTPVRHR